MTLHEHDFFMTYHPLPSPHDAADPVWTREETEGYPLERVWTLIEGAESDNVYALPGYHTINVYGYCVTALPWEDPKTSAFFYTGKPWTDRTERRKGQKHPADEAEDTNLWPSGATRETFKW